MAWQNRYTFLTVANLLIPVAVAIFAIGFFPYKPFLPGLAEFKPLPEYDSSPAVVFDKVVFMVVDALRSDFVYGEKSGFSFTQSLIRNGNALPFTAHATSPTITMPRVKAITTGSIPSFLDVILNFAESDKSSSLATQDTWLAQIKASGGNLVMYGDDTWLKLFPEFFERADGTSSFFVSDFTEVDNNVTRHVPEELSNSDWSGMIMHYLGLDHIGHKAGPNSPNMIPKQKEMDAIVKQIYSAIESEAHLQSTLLVLCGDHGMNDGGNHGGSGPGETSPALVFMSPKLASISTGLESPIEPKDDGFNFYTTVEQSDIAPTLSGLMGNPVPQNNLGVFIPDFLPLWNEDEKVQLLLRNAMQMLEIVRATFPHPAFDNPFAHLDECDKPSDSGIELACKWRRVTDVFRALEGRKPREAGVRDALLDFCKTAQSTLSSTASNYSVSHLCLGIAIAGVAVVFTLGSLPLRKVFASADGKVLTLLLGLFSVMMFASSYVEEEQHFWYWFTSFWLVYLSLAHHNPYTKLPSTVPIFTLLLHRAIIRWNQTGQKHAGSPDTVQMLLSHPKLLWCLASITYFDLCVRFGGHFSPKSDTDVSSEGKTGLQRLQQGLMKISQANTSAFTASSSLGCAALVFKLAFVCRDAPELVTWLPTVAFDILSKDVDLVLAARLVFIGLTAGAGWILVQDRISRKKGGNGVELASALHDFLTLFLVTQTKLQNIPLYFMFRLQLAFFSFIPLTPIRISITSLLLAHTSFFAMGNSNAISSIDLSNAYNGVSGYSVVTVGILTFVDNWAGPIWWTSGMAMLLTPPKKNSLRKEKKWVQQEREAPKKNLSASQNAEPEELKALKATIGGVLKGAKIVKVDKATAPSNDTPAPIPSLPNDSQPSTTSSHSNKFSHGSKDDSSPIFTFLSIQTLFFTTALIAVMAACTLLRTHLFIWTVFSPKYLFVMAWTLAYHLGVTVVLGVIVAKAVLL